MKKKSFFGVSAKLALMLVAICGMFASCYEKEEISVDGSTPAAPVYKIAGVVSDAMNGNALQGVKVNGTTTGADGTYELTVGAGMNVITFKMDEYKTVTSSVYVESITTGTAVYTANAAMYPGKDVPDYKTVKYSIKGSVNNTVGKAVALKSVVIAGLGNVTVSGNTFTAADVQPGSYSAVLTADNYNKTYATINVAPVVAQEGEGEQAAVTEVTLLMTKPGEQAKYIVIGSLLNEEGKPVIGATVDVKTSNGFSASTTSANDGAFSVEIPFEYITPTTMAIIRTNKIGYMPQTVSVVVPLNEEDAFVYAFAGTLTLEAIGEVPDEDPSQGGDATVEVPVEEAKATPVEEVLKDAEVKANVETVAKELGIDLSKIETVPVVKVAEAATIELVSTEAVVNEAGETTQETTVVTDQITIPAGTQVYYVAGVAQNVSLQRDIVTEKATAAVRTYEGTPSGAVFSKPLEIKFVPQTTITSEPDYVLGVLYLDEQTNTWKQDANNYAEYDATSKAFLGKISHFSKFRFGYVTEFAAKDSADLKADYIEKACYTGSSSAIVTVKGKYMGGSAYKDNTPKMAAAAALKGMNEETINYVALLLQNIIKADNGNILPQNNYTAQTISVDMTIPAYKQVNGFNLARKQVTKVYTVHVITKDKKTIDVTVSVNKIISATLTADLAIGHTHGHGNGEDLNAGGGIIDFE